MNAKLLKILSATVAAAMMTTYQQPVSAQNTEQPSANPPPVPSEELPAGSQVLASGPVHEAFAKPVSMDPQAPVIVPRQPPENLQEMPPAERPAGADVVWVPGYWAWDADRDDFIWVSGCWRNAPPNTSWVPGHWLQLDSGWEWISGFWRATDAQPQQEIEYLPAPPPSFEVDATGAPLAPDQVWVPGCWFWSGGRYIQRHGYWITQQVGWVWVPSHFAWTPRGYIFCQGHWDHDLDNRGVLFAPAYFPARARVQAGFVFCPGVCIDLGILRLNLFCAPRYSHYYFGDYYDDSYRKAGVYPWYQCQTVHTWYDPLFVYDRWHFGRTDPHWADEQARQFALLRSNRDLRPARTFTALKEQMAHMPAAHRPDRPMLQPIKTYAASGSTPVRFERISTTERQQITVKTKEVGKLRDERTRWEAPPVKHETVTDTKHASQAEASPRSEPAPKKASRKASQPEIVPAGPVRVTIPEREVLPVSSTPKPSESRYIEKEPPSRPTKERSFQGTSSDREGSDRNSKDKFQSGGPQEKDRQR